MKIHKITMKANIIYISQLHSIIWYIIYFDSNSLLLKDNENHKYTEEILKHEYDLTMEKTNLKINQDFLRYSDSDMENFYQAQLRFHDT